MFDKLKNMVQKGYGVYEARDLLGISKYAYRQLPIEQRKELQEYKPKEVEIREPKPRGTHEQGQSDKFILNSY